MNANAQATPSLEAGFTLIEMLVVVTILALVTALFVPLLPNNPDGLRLRTASNELMAALRVTRAAAILRNSEVTLAIDVDRRIFQSAVVSARPFAQDINAKLTFASGVSSAQSEGGFRFFPDGSSTGGTVTLSLHGREERLCVEWLTGAIRQERIC